MASDLESTTGFWPNLGILVNPGKGYRRCDEPPLYFISIMSQSEGILWGFTTLYGVLY